MAIFYLESLFYATVPNPSWEIFEKIPKFQKFKDAHTSNLKHSCSSVVPSPDFVPKRGSRVGTEMGIPDLVLGFSKVQSKKSGPSRD